MKISEIHNKGITLIEMLVSISILSMIMSVVLFSYSQFNDTLALSAVGQEISVAVRQTQTYGLSAKELSVGGGNFNVAYGVYFTLTDPNYYYIFADKNNNEKYDGDSTCNPSSECLEKDLLRNNVTITSLCGTDFGGTEQCPPNPSVRSVNITFLRPNPDADIRFTNNGGNFYGGVFQSSKVVLTSPQGKQSSVTIESTGQISVQ